MTNLIKVLYFARLKESLNYSTEDMDLPVGVKTISQLKEHLANVVRLGRPCLMDRSPFVLRSIMRL